MWPRCLCTAIQHVETIESVRFRGPCFAGEHSESYDSAALCHCACSSRNGVVLKSLLSGLSYIPETSHLDSLSARGLARYASPVGLM